MAMELVSTVTVGSGGAASIEFTGIAGTGKDLLVYVSARSSWTGHDDLVMRVNNNSNSIYNWRNLRGDGASATSSSGTSQTLALVGRTTGTNLTANTFSNQQIYLPNYAGSSDKSYSADSVNENNATTAWQLLDAGRIATTSAITSLQFDTNNGGSFGEFTTISLYIIS